MKFTQDWFTHNIPTLEKYLGKYKNMTGIRAIEIGCFEGLSTRWFLKNILTGKNSHIHVIDTFKGSGLEHKDIDTNNLLGKFNENVVSDFPEKVSINIGESCCIMPNLYDLQADFIYIDGSHKATDVFIDAIHSWQAIRNGGLLIFDDYEWPSLNVARLDLPEIEKPKLAIDYFLGVFAGQYWLLHRDYQVIIQKI